MGFCHCFICGVTLKDDRDFEDHLKQLSHLRSLEDRKLISAEHLNLLIRRDNLQLGRNSVAEEFQETEEKLYFHKFIRFLKLRNIIYHKTFHYCR